MKTPFTERLKFLKAEIGYTNDDLAQKFKVGAVTVSRWVTGECKPTRKHAAEIDKTLGNLFRRTA